MHVVKGYPDGVFCWVDVGTTDAEAAKAFYQGLFGWEYDDQPVGDGTVYTMCQLGGLNVAGLSALPPDMLAQGVPPMWTSYIKHDDVDAVAARVAEAGGTLTMPPMDVLETGRMAIIIDPGGAGFGVWQPKSHTGAQLVNQPNTLTWNELHTRSVDEAKAFYRAVFGWGYATDENGYVSLKVEDRTQAGMMPMDESWGETPPNWAVYFLVEDVASTTDQAAELGGTVLMPVAPAGEIGQFAVLQDPQGAVFSVIEYKGPADTPPG